MMRHAHRYVLLAAATLGLLFAEGPAALASGSTSHFPYTTTTLTHSGVERLVAHGEHLRLTSKFAEKTEVRLFVYGRVLDRVGLRPVNAPKLKTYLPNSKVYISPLTHVIFDHPGEHSVTLHVNRAYRAALLRAGTITEGYYYAGYKLIHHP